MDLSTFNILSLCTGAGGLDLGVALAVPAARTVCCVEYEAYACEVLAHRMAEEALDEAPIWTNLRTFDGKPWRGVVDCVIGGYPCQPFSVAGRKLGEDDPRYLWPQVARILREVRPAFAFFENVSNHLNIGYRDVRRELEEMGYRVKEGLFTAAEVGATHRRERLFILAHNDGGGRGEWADEAQPRPAGRSETREPKGCHGHVAHLYGTGLEERQPGGGEGERQAVWRGSPGPADVYLALADAECPERRSDDDRRGYCCEGQDGAGQTSGWPGQRGPALEHECREDGYRPDGRPPVALVAVGHPTDIGYERGGEPWGWRAGPASAGPAVGVAHRSGSPQPLGIRRDHGPEQQAAFGTGGLSLFPPGPDDRHGWETALRSDPTLEPAVRRVADGLAERVGRLRLCGNGVVPLVAAFAFRTLAESLFEVKEDEQAN